MHRNPSYLVLLVFFAGTIPAPAMAELAGVARSTDGIGYSHIYAAFNLAYAFGTASEFLFCNQSDTTFKYACAAGPLVGSQLYDHVRNGFTVVAGLATFLLFLALVLVVLWMGDIPLPVQIKSRFCFRTSPPATCTCRKEVPL